MSDSRQMQEQGERLQDLISFLKINQLEFSKATGIQQSQLSTMIHGKQKISTTAINKIIETYPMVDTHWIMTGDGEPFRPKEVKKTLDLVSEPEFPYLKSKKSVLDEEVLQDSDLRKTLGNNLKTLGEAWNMKNNELFSLIIPGTAKQTVSNYVNGASQIPLAGLIRIERSTGIGIGEWITRPISAQELPPAPLESKVDKISMVKEVLTNLLDQI